MLGAEGTRQQRDGRTLARPSVSFVLLRVWDIDLTLDQPMIKLISVYQGWG